MLERKDLVKASLGSSELRIRTNAHGILESCKGTVILKENEGDFYYVNGNFAIASVRYYKLNQIAGISILTPPTVSVDGQPRGNPCLSYDENGNLLEVFVRKIAFGRAPTGSLVAIDQTVRFSPKAYFKRALIKKFEKDRTFGRLTAKEEAEKFTKAGTHMFVPIEGSLGLLLDLSHPVVREALTTYVENCIFGDRKAATAAERNALRKHPALAITTVKPMGAQGQRTAEVTVYGFRHSYRTLDELESAAIKATEQGSECEVIKETAEISDEEIHEANRELDVEVPAVVKESQTEKPLEKPIEGLVKESLEEKPSEKPKDSKQKLKERVQEVLSQLSPDEITKILKTNGVTTLDTANAIQLASIEITAKTALKEKTK